MHGRHGSLIKMMYYCIIIVAIFIFIPISNSHAAKMTQMTFASPDKAFGMLIAAVKSGDAGQLAAIFGPAVKDIFPADEEANAKARERFIKAYDVKQRLENIGTNKVILHVGDNDWPWPVPVIKAGNRWRFDTKAGMKEIIARRIGKNEISVVQVCLAYVDSQLEYASEHRVKGIGEYEQHLASDPDKKNGLSWDSKDGEKPSLLGPMVAGACKTEMKRMIRQYSPYHGYYYKILKSQGKDAPGGSYDYVVDGRMIGGFAMVAYPAVYGSSGITTFIVNKDGIIYQKDLGNDTEKIAESMDSYNPDSSWKKVD
jgi:hypothetical protein